MPTSPLRNGFGRKLDRLDMSPAPQITVCLVGFEQQKATPDLRDDSGFSLRIQNADASPFLEAFKTSPDAFHNFRIEQRIGKKVRSSTLRAQIVKIEEGTAEARILLRPHPSYGPAAMTPLH